MESQIETQAFMTPLEVAEVLRVKERTVLEWARKGKFPGSFVTRRATRIPREAVYSRQSA